MDYNVIIITEGDLADDPAFVHPFKANTVDDFKVGIGEAIAEWQRYNLDREFLEAGCTVLIESQSSLVRPKLLPMRWFELEGAAS